MTNTKNVAVKSTSSEALDHRSNRNKIQVWRVGLALAVFVFTIVSYDDQYMRWWYLSLIIGFSILVLQFTGFVLIRAYALWIGVFIVVQSLVSVFYLNHHFLTLLPNQEYTIHYDSKFPGLDGVHKVTTDAQGFRTTKPIAYNQDSPFRIFAIGGSTTEQIKLDDRQTFTHLLQEDLEEALGVDVEIVNTGVSGLRAINHIATLEYVANLHPDLAIILVGVNDWNRHIHRHYPADIPEEMADRGFPGWQLGIRLRNTLLGQAGVAIQMSLTSQQSGQPVKQERSDGEKPKQSSLQLADVRTFRPDVVSDEYDTHISTLLELCRQLEIPCLMVTQPNAYKKNAADSIKATFWMTPPYAEYTLDFESMVHIARLYNDFLIRKSALESVPLCDIDTKMTPGFDSYYDDVHFNTPGARRVADLLLPCVLDIVKNQGQAAQ